ncbi:cobalamin synthesis protein P47K [Desulfofundulus kuznetsovii DSM 6115]|uniref:Cobalamin synthesis protein P47K n=1 Tax=Desulfofundulus kuznetsovii (strain DSM 6115 / VKM B-1805 / 17) TaxID=760568 RepID=A0AAU8PVV7_DESK7|nr:cobalamin synthesis protein P47K [Desulfofundulus kuznetsovii DSM 6115]
MLVDIVNGFLGSGKTTFIQNLVKKLVPLERIVVLVNDFGEIVIDGALLAQNDLDVVELSSGCICCSLAADLGRQLLDIATKVRPDRLIVEPTGVATIQGLLSVIGSLRLEKYIEAVKVILLIDAAEFKDFHAGYRTFVESQISLADIVIINKCDLVSAAEAREIRKTISTVNQRATVVETTFGQVALEQMGAPPAQGDLPGGGGDECLRHHHHHHEKRLPTYQSFSREYKGVFDLKSLQNYFQSLNSLPQGKVVRAKGIFQCPEGWYRIDFVPATGIKANPVTVNLDNSRVLIIGLDLNHLSLAGSLEECRLVPAGGTGV